MALSYVQLKVKGDRMKIGLITFQRTENYGAALQCRALYTYLSKLGNEVEIMDYRNSIVEAPYRIIPRFRKNILKLFFQYFYTILHYKEMRDKSHKFFRFLMDVKVSRPMNSYEICKCNFDYDVIVAGSDQIWNPQITGGLDKVYYLGFDGKFKKVGYAISLGDIHCHQFFEKDFISYVKKFDILSFREPDAAGFVSEKTGENFQQVLDPTLLLTQNQWNDIIGDMLYNIPAKYVLVYFVIEGQSSQEIIKIADFLSKQNDIPIVYLKMNRNFRESFKRKVISVIDAGPREFLYLIKNATYVVTSSFHGVALSCIYQKDLSVMIPEIRESRVKALVEMFHLEDRVYNSCNDFCRQANKYKKQVITDTEEYKQALKRSDAYLQQINKN